MDFGFVYQYFDDFAWSSHFFPINNMNIECARVKFLQSEELQWIWLEFCANVMRWLQVNEYDYLSIDWPINDKFGHCLNNSTIDDTPLLFSINYCSIKMKNYSIHTEIVPSQRQADIVLPKKKY